MTISKKMFSITMQIVIISVLATIFYYRSLSNFFYADDFIWLNRAKHISGNWHSIFNKENTYFTPLTYVSYVMNYRLSGLEPLWYHATDLFLHIANGTLLCLLAHRLSGSRLLSLAAGIIFITSSSIVNAVIWPAARPDTISTMLVLAAVITHLEFRDSKFRSLPVLFYFLALGAKGTAIVIPLLLLVVDGAELSKKSLARMTPYWIITAIFGLLLILVNFFGVSKFAATHQSLKFINYLKVIPLMVIPERYLYELGTLWLGAICLLIIVAMMYLNVRLKSGCIRIGTAMVFLGLFPVFFTFEYHLFGATTLTFRAVVSPSNRIYLSCAGMALVYAALLKVTVDRYQGVLSRGICLALFAGLLCFNYSEIQTRTIRWGIESSEVKGGIETIRRYSHKLSNDTKLLLFNFGGSPGFNRAMIYSWFDFDNLDLHSFGSESIDKVTNFESTFLHDPKLNSNPASVLLIVNSPDRQHEAYLNMAGNMILQGLLNDLSIIKNSSSRSDIAWAKYRIYKGLDELREVFIFCITGGRTSVLERKS